MRSAGMKNMTANIETANEVHSTIRFPGRLCRQIVKAACHGLDMYEMDVNHHLVKGRIVHHIIPLAEAPDKALTLTNLVYVSDKTHRMIHDAYDKDAESKARMQRKLFELSKKIFGGRG